MTKNVSLSFFLVVLTFFFTDGLVLHMKLKQDHMSEKQNHKAYSLVHQRVSQFVHFDTQSNPEIDMNGPVGQFFMWMMSDKDVVDSAANNKPLSDETADRIRDYLNDHPEVIDTFISQGNPDDATVQCLNRLNKEQKKKFYGWVLDYIDFKNMFLEDAEPPKIGDDEMDKLTEKAMNDPELGPVFSSCGGKTQPSSI